MCFECLEPLLMAPGSPLVLVTEPVSVCVRLSKVLHVASAMHAVFNTTLPSALQLPVDRTAVKIPALSGNVHSSFPRKVFLIDSNHNATFDTAPGSALKLSIDRSAIKVPANLPVSLPRQKAEVLVNSSEIVASIQSVQHRALGPPELRSQMSSPPSGTPHAEHDGGNDAAIVQDYCTSRRSD
jgi:hypothetical protein